MIHFQEEHTVDSTEHETTMDPATKGTELCGGPQLVHIAAGPLAAQGQ